MPGRVLFCADPLRPRRVDEHFAAEAEAVREAGGRVALIDHDALLRRDASSAVDRVPRDLGPAWYRGWMIPVDRYRELAEALTARGTGLVVWPEDYRRAHELPGWYNVFAGVTPLSVWCGAEPGVVGAHPDAPDRRTAPDLASVRPLVHTLGCRFVTTDLARRTGGEWRVVEVGDGQVNDRPSTVDPAVLTAALVDS